MKTLCTLLAVAGTIAVAGCGSSSSSSSSSSAPAASSSSTAAASTTSSAAASSAAAAKPALAQEVAACKSAIAAQSTIPASFKDKLNHICDVAGTGNEGAVNKATHDVCIEVIKAKLPASAQATAEASCPPA